MRRSAIHPAMPGIFISYRRSDDSGRDAVDLAKRLCDAFGPDLVFHDITGIQPGEKFAAALRERLRWCSVMLVLIGRRWLDKREGSGGLNRLHDPDDWVRAEILAGLGRKRTVVIPVLVAGATLPESDQLPDPLRPLLENNAFRLDPDPHWEDDVRRLIKSLVDRGLEPLSDTTISADGGSHQATTRYSTEDCKGRWHLEVDDGVVEIQLRADGSWIATAPYEGILSLIKRYGGEWSVKKDVLRITQTHFGFLSILGPLREGSSSWAAGRIRKITANEIVLADGTTLNAV